MKKIFITVTMLIICAFTAFAAVMETITVSTTAIGLSWNSGYHASCRVETNNIRIRVDGGTPTASVGTIIYATESFTLDSPDEVRNFKAIRTGADATLTCTIY